MVEMVIVKSKLKEIADECNVGSDFAEALNLSVVSEVKKATSRAQANGRKTVQGRDVFVGSINAKEMLVSKSKVKALVEELNVSGDFAEALNEVVVTMVSQAAAKANANGRKTVGARDL
ncbi:MAG: hypothetical protein ACMXYB_03525 [Candidatus Woesearchaeota archaeon]